jgi:hypothetical protein
MVELGLFGALVFAVGGALIFNLLQTMLTRGNEVNGMGTTVFSFMGFLLIGLGILLIIRDAKRS